MARHFYYLLYIPSLLPKYDRERFQKVFSYFHFKVFHFKKLSKNKANEKLEKKFLNVIKTRFVLNLMFEKSFSFKMIAQISRADLNVNLYTNLLAGAGDWFDFDLKFTVSLKTKNTN